MAEALNTAPGVLALALAIELAIGDPVSRWHPVALFGRLMEAIIARAPARGEIRRLAYGALVVGIGVGGVALASAAALQWIEGLSGVLAPLAGALFLKAGFSYRQLEAEALAVARQLKSGQLVGARASLRALVGRDTQSLPPALAASAALESLAENLSDSFVAPLFYYLLLGVPGALAYRALNTLDAMVGYHGPYEHLGRWAARLDDAANFLPARLTAGLLALVAPLRGGQLLRAAAVAVRDHGRTESPNAGWPMAAMAGAVGVRLEKIGHYRLGDTGRDCSPEAISLGAGVGRRAAILAAGLALIAAGVRG